MDEARILVKVSPAVWQQIRHVPGVRGRLLKALDTGDESEFQRIVEQAQKGKLSTVPVRIYQAPQQPPAPAGVQPAIIPLAVPIPQIRQTPPVTKVATRKKVLIVADVPNWAWAKKAEQLVRHISEFQVDICYLQKEGLKSGYDLYHTFDFVQITNIPAGLKATTGITAHVWKTWEGRYGEGTVRGWCGLSAGVHANSVLLQKEIEEYLGRPVHYLPNGVDEQFFRRTRERQPNKKLVVGFVGKPNPRKGRDLIQQAAHKAGVDFREIRRSSHTALSAEDVREFYQDIHVLAVASNMDGTPNPALEAAACECTIISNRIGNMPEFIRHGENGFLVERDVDSLARAFSALTPERAIAMGKLARRTVEQEWTWTKMARNYANMWNHILG